MSCISPYSFTPNWMCPLRTLYLLLFFSFFLFTSAIYYFFCKFGGSGRALGGTSTNTGGGWLGGKTATSEGSTGQSKDREVMAARRLAALSQQQQQQQQQGFGTSSSGPGAVSQTNEEDLSRLQVSEHRRTVMAVAATGRYEKGSPQIPTPEPPPSTSRGVSSLSTSVTPHTSLLAASRHRGLPYT